jgi:hypothetical protein
LVKDHQPHSSKNILLLELRVSMDMAQVAQVVWLAISQQSEILAGIHILPAQVQFKQQLESVTAARQQQTPAAVAAAVLVIQIQRPTPAVMAQTD